MKSKWKNKYRTLQEYYTQEFDSKYFTFTPDQITVDPDEANALGAYEFYDINRQTEEFIKCGKSFAYFCHKYIKILHPTSGSMPFILFNYQKKIIEEYGQHRFNIISKFRQGGLTTVTVIWGLWRCMFKNKEILMLLSKTDREAKVAGEILDRALRDFPSWLQPEFITDSKHEKSFKATGSSFFFYTPEAARGRSITYLFIDEAAHITDMREHWKAMYPTISTGGNAVVISTVKGVGNWYEETFHGAQDHMNPFHVIEIDYTEHPDYSNEKWVKETRAILGEKGWLQEIMRQFLGSGETFIRSDIIIELASYTKDIEPIRRLFPEWNNQDEVQEQILAEIAKGNDITQNWEQGALWIFQEPIEGRDYIIGLDASDGIGSEGDNNCFQVLDATYMVQVAEFYSNNIPTYEFSHITAMVGNMYNKASIVVENMAQGKAVLDNLIHTLRYENVFHQDFKKPGIKVGRMNRPFILDALYNALAGKRVIINSKRLVKELKTFIYEAKTKKPRAMNGKHDDAIFAMAHALHIKGNLVRNLPYGAENLLGQEDPWKTATYQKIKEELSKGAPEEWFEMEDETKIFGEDNEEAMSDFAFNYRRKNDSLLREFGL